MEIYRENVHISTKEKTYFHPFNTDICCHRSFFNHRLHVSTRRSHSSFVESTQNRLLVIAYYFVLLGSFRHLARARSQLDELLYGLLRLQYSDAI
jgi:hypothetical protein